MYQHLITKKVNYLLINKFIYSNLKNFYNIKNVKLELNNKEFKNKDKLIYCITILNKLNKKKPKFNLIINSKDSILFDFEKKLNLKNLVLLFNLLKKKSKIFDFFLTKKSNEYKIGLKGCLVENFLYFEEIFYINTIVGGGNIYKLLFILSTLN